MDDGRGSPPPLEARAHPRVARRRWPVVAAAVLVLGGAGMIGAAALDHRDEPALVSAAAAAAPDVGGASDRAHRGAPHPAAVPASPEAAPAAGSTGGTASQDAAPPPPPPPLPALPVRVSIPSIGVDSSLLQLGLAADGSIAVPQLGPDYDSAAWFTGSPRPGAVGPAVIEGHVDSVSSGPSAFSRLGELAVGARVAVTRADGSTVTFAVTGAQRYAKDDFPTLAVYGNTDGPQLRLITCGGSFDTAKGHYRDNTVVFAQQV